MAGWSRKYEGNTHKVILDELRRLSKINAPYMNVLPLIKSSGPGRSKVVLDELRKLVFTIPFDLRKDDQDGCA